MAPRRRIPARWSLYGPPSKGKPPVPRASHLVTPVFPNPSLGALFSGLLPGRDHNEDLVKALKRLPRAGSSEQPVFAVFAADPFMQGKYIAHRLLEKGYTRVVNWPTTAQYGAEFCAALDSVDIGPQREYENLLQLGKLGLSVSVSVCTTDATAEIAQLNPELVFLTPTFDLCVEGKIGVTEQLRRCAALADSVRGKIPVVLMAARGSVSLAEVHTAGADALLTA